MYGRGPSLCPLPTSVFFCCVLAFLGFTAGVCTSELLAREAGYLNFQCGQILYAICVAFLARRAAVFERQTKDKNFICLFLGFFCWKFKF